MTSATPHRRGRASGTVAALLVTALTVAGCSASDPDGQSDAANGDDRAPVSLVTELDAADAADVGRSVNAFGLDLLDALAADADTADSDGAGENTVVSPLSAAMLLAMVLAGTDGATAQDVAAGLHLDDSRDGRVGTLQQRLTDTDEVTVSVADSLWADEDVPFHDDYVDFVHETFDATTDTTDLGAPGIVDAVDGWVAEHTDERITELATDLGLPDPEAALVLVNAVTFQGEWRTQFDPADTAEQPFTRADGSQVDVPLMQLREQEFDYAERDGYRMLRLPYGEDGRFGMELVLPDEPDGLAAVTEELDAAEWRAAADALSPQEIDELALPRFTVEWGGDLEPALTALGMGSAFDPASADFAPMSPADLYLDSVVQKTFLQVDEEGTEAAAATGGSVGITSAQPGTSFRVDRPFAFAVRDQQTDTALFLGTVHDPRG